MRMGEAHPKQSKAHSMAKAGYINLAVESPEGRRTHSFPPLLRRNQRSAPLRENVTAREVQESGLASTSLPSTRCWVVVRRCKHASERGAWQRPPSDSWGGPHTQTNSPNEQSAAIHKTRGKGSSFCKGDRYPTPRTLAKGIADPRKPSPSPTNRSHESTADKYGT